MYWEVDLVPRSGEQTIQNQDFQLLGASLGTLLESFFEQKSLNSRIGNHIQTLLVML